jgi:hypothetical protein
MIQIFATLAAIALLVAGCTHKPDATVRIFVDGSDVIKVSGNRLWIEHDTASLPGKLIYVNGQTWTPSWKEKVSSEFVGLNPPLKMRVGNKIQIATLVGRGVVSIEQFPSAENDQTLAVRINDDEFGGADWYEVSISW